MSSVWWCDCVLVDLTEWFCRQLKGFISRCQELSFICALMPHFLQQNIVFTCNQRAAWIKCAFVCASLCFGRGVVSMEASMSTRSYYDISKRELRCFIRLQRLTKIINLIFFIIFFFMMDVSVRCK